MVNHVKLLGWKITMPKLVLLAFGIFLLFWIAPFDGVKIYHAGVSFESSVMAIWFTIAGFWNLIEGLASIPEAKRGVSRTGASLVIGIGIFAMVLALTFFFGGQDLIYGSDALSWSAFIVLALTVGMWFAHAWPEIKDRTSFVKALNG